MLETEPARTMAVLALCTGLRCSELAALKWSDFDWVNSCLCISRAMVHGHIDDVKTEYSEASLPLDPDLAEVILGWKRILNLAQTRILCLRRRSRTARSLIPSAICSSISCARLQSNQA